VPSSLADVARRAGVSVATASRALNGSRHPVSTELRERILRAAEEVGYRPSAVARALVTRRSRIIAVIVGDIVDPYFAEITRGVEDHANRAGYLTIVCNADRSPDAELAYVRVMRDYAAEGIVFAGGGYTTGEGADALAGMVSEAVEEGIAVLTLAPRGFTGPMIAVDNRAAAADLTTYLAGLGHRRIAFVRGPAGLSTGDLRRDGFRAAMRAAGLEPELEFDGDFDHESGHRRVRGGGAAGVPPGRRRRPRAGLGRRHRRHPDRPLRRPHHDEHPPVRAGRDGRPPDHRRGHHHRRGDPVASPGAARDDPSPGARARGPSGPGPPPIGWSEDRTAS
jgi:DNA-binding LacI/PurR family transcriptional regulator